MATVERRQQRDDGPVTYRVRWRDPSGREKSRSFKRRRDADAWRTEVEHLTLSGTYVDAVAGRVTFAAYVEAWMVLQPWAPTTRARTENVVANHLLPALGKHRMAAIRTSDIQGLVATLGRTLAPATVKVVAANLTSIFRAAVKDRVIGHNPCEGIKLPRATQAEVNPPTPEQVHLLVDSVEAEWYPILIAMAGLGLRVSECLGLTADRVDFLRRTVRVDRQIQSIKGRQPELVDRLKTPASYRTIPLPDVVSTALAAAVGRGVGDDGLLFHQQGRPLRRHRVNSAMDRARSRALAIAREADPKADHPLPVHLKPHDLRHFYASMLIASGASVKTVQRCMGHAQASETLDTYGHLWPDHEEVTRHAVDLVLGRVEASPRPATSTESK